MAPKELPSRYFKYMKADRLISILENPCIRFTSPDDLNDPYECHLTLDVAAVKARFRDHLLNQPEAFPAARIEEMVDNNERHLVIDALLEYRRRRNDLRVLSLTTNPLELLMWAHYGDEHRGVVVELDIWHPSIRCGSPGGDMYSSLEEVKYTHQKVFGIPDPMVLIDVLSRKSVEWQYEREWRLIRTKSMTREHKHGVDVVDIDLSVIRSIYFGARTPVEKIKNAVELIETAGINGVNLLKVDIAPHKYELRTTDVSKYGWTLFHREHHFGDAAKEALICLPMEPDR